MGDGRRAVGRAQRLGPLVHVSLRAPTRTPPPHRSQGAEAPSRAPTLGMWTRGWFLRGQKELFTIPNGRFPSKW